MLDSCCPLCYTHPLYPPLFSLYYYDDTRVPSSEIFLQASLRQISDLLTLISYHVPVFSTTCHTHTLSTFTNIYT